MSPPKVTLKDIASRCGVTPTIVSAILNGRNGRITCSAEKRELILKTASELHYQANFFARSIKMKQVPLVGLMLHLNRDTGSVEDDSFVNRCLYRTTAALNRHQLEVLFIPYFSEDEQLTRLQNLLASGLLGGVITNIIPDSHQKICSFLACSQLPYMVLGSPVLDNVYCAYSQTPFRIQRIISLVRERGLSNAYHVLRVNGELRFCRYPFPDDYLWHAPQLTVSEIEFERDTALFVTDIPGLRLLQQSGFSTGNCLLNESRRFQAMIPAGTEAMIFPDLTEETRISTYVETSLVEWMLRDRQPATFRKVFAEKENSWEYLPGSQA